MHAALVPPFIPRLHYGFHCSSLFIIGLFCQFRNPECPDFGTVIRDFILRISEDGTFIKDYSSRGTCIVGTVGNNRAFGMLFP